MKGAESGKEGGSKEFKSSQEAVKDDDESTSCVMIGKMDMDRIIRIVARVAEAEARVSFAPTEVIKALEDSATELVKLI